MGNGRTRQDTAQKIGVYPIMGNDSSSLQESFVLFDGDKPIFSVVDTGSPRDESVFAWHYDATLVFIGPPRREVPCDNSGLIL